MKQENINDTIHLSYTSEELEIIDWAVNKVITCYVSKGGDLRKLMSKDNIRWAIEGILKEDGIDGVKDYIQHKNIYTKEQ